MMKWKKWDAKTWGDDFSKKYNFIVTREKSQFILDIFNKRIKNSSKAYIN